MTNRRRILVIGGLAAGPSAAAKAARTNLNAEVMLFEQSETISYGICETPYAIAGMMDENRLVFHTPESLRQQKNIQVKTLHLVERIVPAKQTIVVRDLRSHSLVEYEYEKLIVATGSASNKLAVPGENGRNVFTLGSRDDAINIINYVKTETPKQAVIIGGGYIGMEMSESLRALGMDVTLIHILRLPMEGLELDTRERVLIELEKNGVQFVTNAQTEAFQQDNTGKVRHVITNRGTFAADIVILSLGVSPNVRLACDAKIRLGVTGAIVTDERQQTNVDGIYAAGDCCEVRNIVTGKPMYLPLATVASRTAWIAGENAAGGRAVFKGAIRAVAVKVFGLDIAQVGISSEEAKANGFQVVTSSITANSKVGVMPGSEKITIDLIIDKRSKCVLGANVYGGHGAVLRANTLGVAIQQKLTIGDIARFDLIYSPPFAPLWDPILVAANEAKKKI
jgi:NADPH-dependent 2,4-dienoyl-CoA reductase/sulfur reductase-like enzyme